MPLSHDSLLPKNFHFSYQMLISRLFLAVMANNQLLGGVCMNCVCACVRVEDLTHALALMGSARCLLV